MLDKFDYAIIIFYLIFLASMGFVFKRFNKGTKDYFAGGFRMSWWLLGASSFISNFSCWTFTGGASLAYNQGIVIFFAITLVDILGFLISVIWFAPRFRNMRLITAMDAVRMRFGRFNEQFFNWIQMANAFFTGAVWMVSLSVILTNTFKIPHMDPADIQGQQMAIIGITGIVVVVIALLGGNWAVAASDFIQLLLLMSVSVVVAILALIKIGGVGELLRSIPPDHWQIFKPLGSTDYDWLYIATAIVNALYMKNNIGYAAKYIAAKDTKNARWSAMVPLFGYMIMPIFWFLPAFAAIKLVPDLMHRGLANPGESAYVSVCLLVLPRGLMGLMIAGMFSATIASMDVALNKNAGFFIKNFYQPILRKKATDRELLLAGEFATLACGILISLLAISYVYIQHHADPNNPHKLNLFDAYLYLSGYIGAPIGIPMFLGVFVKRTPIWAGWSAVLVGIVVTIFCYDLAQKEWVHAMLSHVMSESAYRYLATHHFVTTNLITVPITTLYFLGTRLFYKPQPASNYDKDVNELFRRMKTPVDFEKEVGGDNTPQQAQTIGTMACIYGSFVLLLVFIPNPLSGRIGILACASTLLGVGIALLIYAKYGRKKAAEFAAAHPKP